MLTRHGLCVVVLILANSALTVGCGGTNPGKGVSPDGNAKSVSAASDELLASLKYELQPRTINDEEPIVRFNRARRALGDHFESELVKVVGSDVDLHYWAASFVADGDPKVVLPPRPQLALLLVQQAFVLCEKLPADDRKSSEFTLCVVGAIWAKEAGYDFLAQNYKAKAEKAYAEDKNLAGSFPALSATEHELYDNIRIE